MEIRKLPMKEYLERFPETKKSSKAITDYSEEKPVVYTTKNMSTRTKLHEYYHTTASDEGRSNENLQDFALEELGAEDFASGKMGKELSGESVIYVVSRLYKRGMTSTGAHRVILKALKKLGYAITYDYRTYLKKEIKDCYADWKYR